MAFRILIVDDEKPIHSSLRRLFIKEDYELVHALDGQKALELIAETPPDLMLLDLRMPVVDGFEVLRQLKANQVNLPILVLTGHGGIEEAVEAMKLGASDFLEKSGSPEILITRIQQQYQIWALSQENVSLRRSLRPSFRFPKMIGSSQAMSYLKELILRVAPSDTTVLIQGESGTGKEFVARAIHCHSQREKKPFVVVDCASLHEDVLGSELFGHEKGSFTGADRQREGLIRSANGGTLFFDELGELPLKLQAKLLRVLQEREIRPVGSDQPIPVDIRIVAATNRQLLAEVEQKRFRADLYYRFSAVTLTSPPLRERHGDLNLLIDAILERLNEKSARKLKLGPTAHDQLLGHTYPGNIRELENLLQAAFSFCAGNEIESIPFPHAPQTHSESDRSMDTEGDRMEDYEKLAIQNALKKAGANRRKAAQILDIGEATLYRKLNAYNLN